MTALRFSRKCIPTCASLLFLFAMTCSAGLIGPPPTSELPPISPETASGHVDANNGYSWDYNYSIGYDNGAVTIGIEINFTGLVTEALIDLWEQGIESMWNNTYYLVKDATYQIPVLFDMTQTGPFNYSVDVVEGPHVSNMTEWDDQDTGNVAAHEFGHMMGLYDEYSGGATDPGGELIDPSSIMGSTGAGATPYSRHFEGFRTWIAGHSPEETFRLERYPEPGTWLMAVSALFFIALRKRAGRRR